MLINRFMADSDTVISFKCTRYLFRTMVVSNQIINYDNQLRSHFNKFISPMTAGYCHDMGLLGTITLFTQIPPQLATDCLLMNVNFKCNGRL